MGKEKQSGSTVINQTSQATPTVEETALNQLQLQQAQATQEGSIAAQQSGLNLVNKLLTGSMDLPGYLKTLAGGITEEQTQSMVNQSLRDIMPGFQSQGILDSGTAASIAGRTAGDIRNQNAQFNIGALQNMLNLALSGQAQVQAPVQGVTSQLGSRLAGLRSTTTTGSQSTESYSMNPFLKSFQTSSGELASRAPWAVVGAMCWVASEIFGGWYEPKTCLARNYICNKSPKWFREFYLKYGKRIAKFIHNKPILKLVLRPLFEFFAWRGQEGICLSY